MENHVTGLDGGALLAKKFIFISRKAEKYYALWLKGFRLAKLLTAVAFVLYTVFAIVIAHSTSHVMGHLIVWIIVLFVVIFAFVGLEYFDNYLKRTVMPYMRNYNAVAVFPKIENEDEEESKNEDE